MLHDAHGWWIDEAGPPAALPALAGDHAADVVVVGGGFTGLWAAWHLLQAQPDARVAVLEADRCGFGPSGRNGGFVQSMDLSRPMLVRRFGPEAADALVAATRDSVRAIGAWCEAQGVDACYRAAPHLVVSAAPAQDGVGARAVDGRTVLALSADEVQARCASPVMRSGVEVPVGATVHPARLAFGLRRALLRRGALIFEGSRVRGLQDGTARTDGGRVRAPVALVAAGASTGTLPALRRSLTVASSHIVLTEPVPDVIAALGWTGGEAISDGRTLLHYLRTTPDERILFGWAGGRMVVLGLGGTGNGYPRESGFDIVVASEVMAIFCLASDLHDLKERLGDIVIGYTRDRRQVHARDLGAHGAMTAVLRDALAPNLVQTLENTPAVPGGRRSRPARCRADPSATTAPRRPVSASAGNSATRTSRDMSTPGIRASAACTSCDCTDRPNGQPVPSGPPSSGW